MLQYDSLEQARMRLRNSVITYQDRAVNVVDVIEKGPGKVLTLVLQNYPLNPNGRATEVYEVSQTDQDLNFRVFKLGYLNDSRSKRAGFVFRQTKRQQVQGISFQQLGGLVGLSDFAVYGSEFEDMLFERYPTVDEAMKRLNEQDWQSVGISRFFAIQADPDIKLLRSLMYRGRRVGVALGTKFSEFLIDERDQYLAEVLSEAGFPFRTE